MRTQQTFGIEFEKLYNSFNETEKGKQLLKLEGIDRAALDIGMMSQKYFTEDLGSISIDANSNANESICPSGYSGEIVKGMMKLDGMYLLHHYAEKRFGLVRANELLSAIFSGLVYFHDSSGAGIQQNYCFAYSTSMIMTEGRPYGQLHSLPPKRAKSFTAQVIETTMNLSMEFVGAIAISDFLVNYSWYAKNEELSDADIVNDLQSLIWVLNNKFRTSGQSAFTNISIFDRPNLEKIFAHHTYPDGSSPDFDYIMKVQKLYAEFFANGDPSTGLPFRFPISTINISCDENKNIPDQEFLDWASKINTPTGCFNIYVNEGTKLASCCLSGTIKVVARINNQVKYITIQQLYEFWARKQSDDKIEIMGTNGFVKIVNGFKIQNTSGKMIRVVLKNGLYITTTEDHPSVKEVNGALIEVPAIELTTDDRIPVSKNISYDAYKGSRDLGRFVGLFAAEGLYDARRDTEISFCFHTEEKDLQSFVISFAENNFGADTRIDVSTVWPNSTRIIIMSKMAHGLMRDMLNGDLCTTKRMKSKIFDMSSDFRLGFIEGFIEGDGYTNDHTRSDYGSMHIGNAKLGQDLVALMNTLNIKSSYKSTSTNGTTINIATIDKHKIKPLSDWIRNSDTYSTHLRDYDNYYSVGIKSIQHLETEPNTVYDFEVDSDDHLFQIANGIITHNCRLLSDSSRMPFMADSFGNGGVSLGSHRVVTINLPRIALLAEGNVERFEKQLIKALDIARDLLLVHREEIIERRIAQGFLQFYQPLKWFSMKQMFSTFGITGMYEANYFMGLNIREDGGQRFTSDILQMIDDYAVKTSRETGHSFNCEEVPAESVAIKLCQKDKILFGETPFEMYSNQFIPLVEPASIPERIKITGKFCDIMSGGSILHINLMEKIKDPDTMKKLIEYAVKNGVSHFAVNYAFGTCENGHITVCGNSTVCPICSGKITDWMTRIVGYYTHISSWSPTRRDWEFPRREFGEVESLS